MLVLRAALTVSLVLVLCVPAQASRYDPYLRIARAHFPATCWPITLEQAQEASPWGDLLAFPHECRILLPADFTGYSRTEKCEMLAHEVGHLAGIEKHSSNPRSVMWFAPTGRSALCRRFHPRIPRGQIAG